MIKKHDFARVRKDTRKKSQQLQQDTGRHKEDTTRTLPEHQDAPRNTAGHSKASQMIPKRLSGASQKPLWKDLSFMPVKSVDPGKIF